MRCLRFIKFSGLHLHKPFMRPLSTSRPAHRPTSGRPLGAGSPAAPQPPGGRQTHPVLGRRRGAGHLIIKFSLRALTGF